MTYTEQFEQMPFVFKLTIGFVGGLALMFAGLVAMTLLLIIRKVVIGGLCFGTYAIEPQRPGRYDSFTDEWAAVRTTVV